MYSEEKIIYKLTGTSTLLISLITEIDSLLIVPDSSLMNAAIITIIMMIANEMVPQKPSYILTLSRI